jgi:hypothetical protein
VAGANRSSLKAFGVIVSGFVVVWVVLDRSATWLDSNMGEAGVLVCALVILAALVVERLLFGTGPRRALRRLGFGRPNGRAILAGSLVALAMISFYPIFSLITGAQVSLHSGWMLMALGLFLQHGIAEEGAVSRLPVPAPARRAHVLAGGIPLHGSLCRCAPLAADLPRLRGGVASILVAVATAFPLAFMFERDNNTIWTPALLHGAAHSIKLVSIPDGVFPTAALIWFAVVAVVPYLVIAFPKSFFEPGGNRAAWRTPTIPGGTGNASMSKKKPDRDETEGNLEKGV